MIMLGADSGQGDAGDCAQTSTSFATGMKLLEGLLSRVVPCPFWPNTTVPRAKPIREGDMKCRNAQLVKHKWLSQYMPKRHAFSPSATFCTATIWWGLRSRYENR